MTRTRVIAIAALMLLCSRAAAAQSLLPVSVRQFLDECITGTSARPPFARVYMPPRVVDGRQMIDAFIAIRDESAIALLQSHGVAVNCQFDGFVTAQIPVDNLADVSCLPGVTDVEIGRRMQLCTDSTLSVTRAGEVHDGIGHGLPWAYTGRGVIVGVIDRGIDFQHRSFRRSDDTTRTRIVRVYNTHDNSGHPSTYINSYGSEFKMPGSVFMDDEIYALTSDAPSETHGTHTTSIAAGAHVGQYGGMAPDADIVVATPTVLDGSLSSTEIANCARYIRAYADSVGKPCVMSMSVSTPNGQHDGQDYLSKALEQVTGPGRIFVIAAGNCGNTPVYAHKRASKANALNLLFKCGTAGADSSYNYSRCITDIWMRDQNCKPSYQLHILDKNTGQIVWTSDTLNKSLTIKTSSLGGYFTYDPAVDTLGYIHTYVSLSSYGRKYQFQTSIYNLVCTGDSTSASGKHMSRYAIGVSIWPSRTEPCEIDAWMCNSNCAFATYGSPVIMPGGEAIPRFYSAGTDSCTIGTYAVNDAIISAGAYIARNSYYSMTQNRMVTDNSGTIGDIAKFSSYQAEGYGPTGVPLPTVCAPGFNVVAAGSRYSNYARNSAYTVMKSDDGSPWCVMSGTSMAAPTVAGIIALWLQANPNLTVAQIKEIIAETAIKDSYTEGGHHAQFGANGKIDAMAGMVRVLETLPHPLGDVNADGIFDVTDLSALIDHLLGNTKGLFISTAADIDGNDQIDVRDLSAMIDLLLNE